MITIIIIKKMLIILRNFKINKKTENIQIYQSIQIRTKIKKDQVFDLL